MKNYATLIFAVSLIFVIGSGCGITERIQKTLGTNSAETNSGARANQTDAGNIEITETNPDGEKIGIAECDEVFELLTEGMKPKEDDTYVTKATREFYLNKIRESFRESIKTEKDREKLQKNCAQYLEQLKKYKAEEENKQQ